MSAVAAARRRATDWAAPLTTLAVGALLAAIAVGAGGGQALASATRVERLLILVGGAATATALLVAPPRPRVRGGLVLALLAALAALAALSISWAVEPSSAWIEANRLFAYAAALAAAIALARVAPQRWPSIIGGVLLATTAVSAYALLTKLFPEWLNEFELFARLRKPFGYWNAVGLMGALAVPACLWLGSRREGPLLSALAFPALGICLSVTLMAYSRGALLAAAIGAIVWFALVPLRLRGATVLIIGAAGQRSSPCGRSARTRSPPTAPRSTSARRPATSCSCSSSSWSRSSTSPGSPPGSSPTRGRCAPARRRRTGVVLLVALALTPVAAAGLLATTDEGLGGSLDNAWSSLTDTSEVGPANDPSRLTATGSVRSRYWDEAFQMWRDDPVTGLGAGGYATARPRYRMDLLDVRHAHGYVPETMAELGIIGAAISIALLVAWIVAAQLTIRSARARAGGARDARRHRRRARRARDDRLDVVDPRHRRRRPGVRGLGRGPGTERELGRLRAIDWHDLRRVVAAAAVVLLALFTAWTAWQPLRSSQASDDALAAMDARDFDRARELADTARDRNPLSVDPLFDRASIEQAAYDREAAERALEEAVRLQPANWIGWMRLTDHRLFEQNDARGALEAAKIAIYLNPRSWDVNQRYLDATRRASGRAGEQAPAATP